MKGGVRVGKDEAGAGPDTLGDLVREAAEAGLRGIELSKPCQHTSVTILDLET